MRWYRNVAEGDKCTHLHLPLGTGTNSQKVSGPVYVLYKATLGLTFEKESSAIAAATFILGKKRGGESIHKRQQVLKSPLYNDFIR
jgi:hypothetical protein